MRNVLILSFVALMAVSATGCMGRNTCGGSSGWYPGQHLFGSRNQTMQAAPACCDPCGGGGAMLGAPMMGAPVMTGGEACCQ